MGEFITDQLNRILRAKAVHKRWIAALLCLSILVGLGTVSLLTVTGQAKTYPDKELDCHYAPPSGAGYADFAAHTHNEDCYDAEGTLVCPLPEIKAHYHDESCYTTAEVLVCGLEENDGHVHSEACYGPAQGEPTCGLEESDGHQHDESCYTPVRGELVCTLEENEEHSHTDECYAWTTELVCGMEEGEGAHHHSEACGLTPPELVCGMEEGDGAHRHSEACYETRSVLSCGEQGIHVHSDSCYDGDGNLICGQLHLEAHVHREACFKTADPDVNDKSNQKQIDSELPLPEDNYFEDGMPESDPNADLESWEIWDAMFANLELSGNWTEDLLQVASSQLGYQESVSNFELGSKREMKGYTRYGAWYGIPYGDWCAMFVSFCLNYADIPADYMPRHCSCQAWVDALAEAGLYAGAEGYPPKAGDLIFYDFDQDAWADHVGLVYSADTESGRMTTIEGNRSNSVAMYSLGLEDATIMGYGILPSNPFDIPYSQAVLAEREKEIEKEEEKPGADAATMAQEEEQPAMPAQSFDGEAANLLVHVQAEAGTFPAGTQMVVTPVLADAIKEKAGSLVDGQIVRVLAVDISFLNARDEKIEPEKPVRVSITPKNQAVTDKQEIVHLDRTGAAAIVPQDENSSAEEILFEADSFSVYAVCYTVDFHYDGYVYHIPGGSTVKLGQVLAELGIVDTVLEGSYDPSMVESVVFSDPELVSVEQGKKTLWLFGDDDWVLESLAPFDTLESLTVTMKDGKVIHIAVTDDQTDGVWDLADTNNTQFLHVSADSSVTENEQERNAAFKLTFTYSLTEDVVKAIDEYDDTVTLVYDLSSFSQDFPAEIKNFTSGVISIGSRRLGTYTVVDGVVTLRFTDPSYFDGRTSFTGYFNLTVITDETRLGTENEVTYEFPGTGDTVPVHYKQSVEEGSKSVYSTQNEDGSYTLHYTANINVNTNLDSMTFNDTLGGLQTLDAGSVKINNSPATVTQSGQSFSFDVASALGTTGVAKGSYQVTYDTRVTKEQLEAMEADKTTETNKATWKVNGDKDVPGGETKIELNKPREPIPVEKTITDGQTSHNPGDTVSYSITYGNDKTVLAGFEIADYMTDVQTLQGDISISYGGTTVTMPASAITQPDDRYSTGMVTLFDYRFPDDTEGFGPVTVTYTTKLIDAETAKANGVFDNTDVINIAQEKRQNTSDTEKTTVPFEKEQTVTVEKTAKVEGKTNNKWAPGDIIRYTLTIGDADTDMAGVKISDHMTDLQVLQGDVMIQVGNGQAVKLSDYVQGAVVYTDDGQYSSNQTDVLNFTMPNNAGKGPVIITYTTRVISQEQAEASNIYGEQSINNTGKGGKTSDHTHGVGVFDDYPIAKTVTKAEADVNGQTVSLDDTVHYTLTFGDAGMDMGGKLIMDEMTDLQKLVGNVTVKKADGSSFTMPMGTGQWAQDGVVWNYFDDSKYSESMVRVFCYRLSNDIGKGPIVVEYDARIISEEEAKESGLSGEKSAFNRFTVDNHTAQTEVKIPLPVDPKHNPQVRKEFDHWDVSNSKIYWNIIVEKDDESAYPLENVSVREFWDWSGIYYRSENQGIYHKIVSDGRDFDVIHAVVTTDDGTVLTPGKDYTIDKDNAQFTFPVLNERVHINVAYNSPDQIIDGHYMHNVVQVNNKEKAEAEAKFKNPEIELIKNGKYTDADRILEWEVLLNPTKKAFTDSDPVSVWFTDVLPEGLTLLNYNTLDPDSPSISVKYDGKVSGKEISYPVTVNGNTIEPVDIAAHNPWDPNRNEHYGLDGEKFTIKYKTRLSDEEWDRITSSASGSEVFENHVTITAGDDKSFDATGKVTVTSEEFLNKTDTTAHEAGSNLVVDAGGNSSKEISYQVEINPNGHVLNLGEALTLTDYIATNMDLDPASVKLVDASGNELSAVVISYNDDSRLLTLRNIPDSTPCVLTYTCIARAQGEDTFHNTATLIGGGSHSSSTSEKHTIQTNDAGVKVDGIEMSLHKIDENNISKNLANAKFQLYECELAIGDLTNPEAYPEAFSWDALLATVDRISAGTANAGEEDWVKENFRITNLKEIGDPVTTGDKGYTQWTGLSEHKLYAWKEVEAPDGYTGNGDLHYFVGYQYIDVNSDALPQPLLPEQEQLDRKHAAWALDDACQFANDIRVASMSNLTIWTATNVETEFTSISATKVWEGDSDNLFETRPTDGIRLQLWRINHDGSKEKVGGPVAINADDEGKWPSYIWNRLPAEDGSGNSYRYTVVEEKVENYSTNYSDGGEGQIGGEITVTNKMIPKSTDIFVEKAFEVPEGAELPEQIMVTLLKIRTDKAGNSSEPEDTGLELALSASNTWKGSFEKLPTGEVIDGVPYTLTYTVKEDEAVAKNYTVTYTVDGKEVGGEGVLETSEDKPLVITNKTPEQEFEVTKAWRGFGEEIGTDSWPMGKTITLGLFRSDAQSDTPVLSLTLDGTPQGNPQPVPDASGDYGNVTYTLTFKESTGYVLHVYHLPKLPEGTDYYARETVPVEGYSAYFGDSSGEKVNGKQQAQDGEFLINEANGGYELPRTGGAGTLGIRLLGGMLFCLSFGVFLLLRKKGGGAPI